MGDGVEEGEEGEEGGDVKNLVGGFWVRFRYCGCCCCEEEGCEVFEEVVVAADDDDIRGVVALSVMWMASEGCLAGRLAMFGLAGEAGLPLVRLVCEGGRRDLLERVGR